VQRWLKFVKYLRQQGWEPVVYTPDNPEAPAEDPSLLADIPENVEIIKQPIWEPFSAYKAFIGQKQSQKVNAGFLTEGKKPKLTEKIAVWVRGNFFIPDARMFWVKPSVKFLKKYLTENKVDAIITTGPPHSMHLIGLKLKKQLGLPWVADFRDPWTNIDFYDELMLTCWANYRHHKLEKAVLTKADCTLTVGFTMANEFTAMGAKNVKVITNGFDDDDLDSGIAPKHSPDKHFSIAHVGSINKARNPVLLWKVLANLVKTNPTFGQQLKIKLIGKVDVAVFDSIATFGLEQYVEKTEYLPHRESIAAMSQSAVLLLLVNRTKNAAGILTGKFFEYMATKRPILTIGPMNGDIARIVNETNCGKVVDFDDESGLKSSILELFANYKDNSQRINAQNISKYSRNNLTVKLAEVLNSITKNAHAW
jgi:glycosyltransferase involved in cell wall biosynthesis